MSKLPRVFLLSSLLIACSAVSLKGDIVNETFTDGVIESHNGTSVVWSNGGDSSWYGPGGDALLSGDYYQSGQIVHNQISSLFAVVDITTAGGTVGADYAVSSEAGFDRFEVWINGSNVFSASGIVSGNTGTFDLLSGTNTIEFRYEKDGSVSSGVDAIGIDNVEITGVVPEPTSIIFLAVLALFGIVVRQRSRTREESRMDTSQT